MTTEKLAEFIGITGADEPTAKQYLEMCNNDIQSAIVQFLDHNSENKEAPVIPEDDTVRNPIPQTHERLIEDEGHEFMPRPMVSRRTFRDPNETMAEANNTGDNPRAENGDREESHFYRLFKPPTEILFSGSIEKALDEAQKCGRLLLVSVHDDTCFECHMLNRDVWKEFRILNMIKKSFIFVQPLLGSYDASWYTRKFPYIKESAHFAIIDPVSMQQKAMWTRIVDATMVYEVLKDYAPPEAIVHCSEKRPICMIDLEIDSDESDLEESSPATSSSKRTRTNSYTPDNTDGTATSSNASQIQNSQISKKLSQCSIKENNQIQNITDLSEEELLRIAIENSKKTHQNGHTPATTNSAADHSYATLPEPEAGCETYRLMIRLPCGQRMPLKLASTLPIKILLKHLNTLGYSKDDYELLRVAPRFVIDVTAMIQSDQSLSNLGLNSGDLLHLQEK